MRIRKRKVPLPLSLLSPVPLTDPHLFSRSPVEADHNLPTPTFSSDHAPTPTCCSASDLRPLPDCNHNNSTNVSLAMTGVEGVQISNDDSSNASITTSCAPADDDIIIINNNNGPLLLSNNEGVGRWCDGDRVIPLKKRRTTIVKRDVENEEEEKQMKSSGLSSDTINGDYSNSNSQVSAKKSNGSKRGSTIMEGSRCSRVNGRGWRCCQQTLVGYSLCEHHLGKGRLRSMTSSSTSTTTLKPRSSKKKNASNNTTYSLNKIGSGFVLGNHDAQQKEETFASNNTNSNNNNNNNNNNKRIKLGVVKARSLSSLLGQTNTRNNIVGDHANMHFQQEKSSN